MFEPFSRYHGLKRSGGGDAIVQKFKPRGITFEERVKREIKKLWVLSWLYVITWWQESSDQ